MALVKFGAVITDSRGSVGGITFKSTRAGLVMQRKSTPTKTIGERSSIQRARLQDLSKAWFHELDVTQRDEWRALGIANPRPNTWGDEFPLSGIAIYIGVNLNLAQIEEPRLDDAPADQTVTALATLTLSVAAPNVAEITFSATPTPANHELIIEVTPKLSPGQANYAERFIYLAHYAPGETSPLDIAAAYNSLIGEFVTGSQYAAKCTLIKTTNGARAAALVSATIAT